MDHVLYGKITLNYVEFYSNKMFAKSLVWKVEFLWPKLFENVGLNLLNRSAMHAITFSAYWTPDSNRKDLME